MSRNNFYEDNFLKRIKVLNVKDIDENKDIVVYFIKNSLRVEYNHALEYAVKTANEIKKPLFVLYLLNEKELVTARNAAFLLEGLTDLKQNLHEREILFLTYNTTLENLKPIITKACLVVLDKGYLKEHNEFNLMLANKANIKVVEVESNVIVPVQVASQKEEYSAYTIRPKLNHQLFNYLHEVTKEPYDLNYPKFNFLTELKQYEFNPQELCKNLHHLKVDHSVKKVNAFKGGEKAANKILTDFINNKLVKYDAEKNDPSKDGSSHLSPYLKWGFISALKIYLKVKNSEVKNVNAFLEQLFIRRELSVNFVNYNQNYNNYKGLPAWAKQTLEDHMIDKRENLYTLEELENAKTNDPYWNAAQKEMMLTGKMHNYMRMYWAKRLLEWFLLPMEAYDVALYLNNKYCLDGFDPNSYSGVAWCFGKHDRPWFEKPVFGLVRYMNANGLKTKFNIENYVNKINSLKN